MSDIKVRDYAKKDIDDMTAEELRHGALKWMTAEAKGEGQGDAKAEKAAEPKFKAKVMGEKKPKRKELLSRIEQLERQLKNGGNQ
jgi:hypothetical protein